MKRQCACMQTQFQFMSIKLGCTYVRHFGENSYGFKRLSFFCSMIALFGPPFFLRGLIAKNFPLFLSFCKLGLHKLLSLPLSPYILFFFPCAKCTNTSKTKHTHTHTHTNKQTNFRFNGKGSLLKTQNGREIFLSCVLCKCKHKHTHTHTHTHTYIHTHKQTFPPLQ